MKVKEVPYPTKSELDWEKWRKSESRKKAILAFHSPYNKNSKEWAEINKSLSTLIKLYRDWEDFKPQTFKVTVKRRNGFFAGVINNLKFCLNKMNFVILLPIKNLIKSRNNRKKAIKAFLVK